MGFTKLVLNKMMKGVMKVYLYGKIDESELILLKARWLKVFILLYWDWTALNLCLWESSEI